MKRQIRISQCMIVRNEEKNIQKALSWGKDILYEQIVVDTGSTDHTVELAEGMGAKVFSFDWDDDFSAAKNFAIQQARGNYIAFLDADEYFSEESVKKLHTLLAALEKRQDLKNKDLILQSNMLNLDDDGEVFATAVQNRIFTNSGNLYYVNKIHEVLRSRGRKPQAVIDMTGDLSVYHTGYSSSAYSETQKAERNIRMLKKQLELEPENIEIWAYLGESLMPARKFDEAETAFRKVIANPGALTDMDRKVMSYYNLLRIIVIKDPADAEQQLNEIYKNAQDAGVTSPDIESTVGFWMYNHGKLQETILYLEKTLRLLENYDRRISVRVANELENVYGILSYTYLKLGYKAAAIRYSTLTLRSSRYMDAALETILSLFKQEPGQSHNPDDTLHFLEKIYQFTELKDKLYVMKAAKKVGFYSLYDMLFDLMSAEEQKWLTGKNKSPYRPDRVQAKEKYPDFPYNNETDADFLELMEEIRGRTEKELLEQTQEKLEQLRTEHPDYYNQMINFFAMYPFWGKLDPPENQFDALEARIEVLKENAETFLWLYTHLEDYRSRKCLVAVMDNWLRLNFKGLLSVKESGISYFDPDILRSGQDGVFVDVGAFTGDSTLNFIGTYGEDYKHIYCYEITPESVEQLVRNTKMYSGITVSHNAVYSRTGTLYLSSHDDIAMNRAAIEGTIPVQSVSLDEDIEDPVTFIKMDIGGLEKEALAGSRRHIRNEHPGMAVSIFHNYEDIVKIPQMIADMDSSYRFYIRHYGGNLIPTEFILYAI